MLQRSLAKSQKDTLPPEFSDYADFIRKYKAENPAKFYLATKFGHSIPTLKAKDQMSKTDYFKFMKDEDGTAPKELKKALEKYKERIA